MKNTKRIIAVLVSAMVLASTAAFMFSPKKDFLENENRVPAKKPDFTLSSLAEGKYTIELEEYMKDQFPARDSYMKIKTLSQVSIGYKKLSGVWISDERLMQEVKMPNGKILSDSCNRLFDSIDSNINTAVMLIPNSCSIYHDELPPFASVIDQNAVIDEILAEIDCDHKINPYEPLIDLRKTNNVYYHSDHHWTAHGSYQAYKTYCDAIGIAPSPIMQEQVLSQQFKGTLYSSVPLDKYLDTLSRITVVGEDFLAMHSKSAKGNLLEYDYFAEDYLDKKDKYSYFGGGNFPLTVLINESVATEKEILIIKDSFANCFAPHLTAQFKKIHIIDPRHFKGLKISDYVKENPKISQILVLYGLNSLNDNSGISSIS